MLLKFSSCYESMSHYLCSVSITGGQSGYLIDVDNIGWKKAGIALYKALKVVDPAFIDKEMEEEGILDLSTDTAINEVLGKLDDFNIVKEWAMQLDGKITEYDIAAPEWANDEDGTEFDKELDKCHASIVIIK